MIALFHTLDKNIDKFEQLIQKIAPNEKVEHFVNEAILKDALEKGFVSDATKQVFENEIQNILQLKPEQIICTCSTFGEACKALQAKNIDVKRIDYPIAKYLVQKYNKIGLAYTAKSTLQISTNLLLEVAEEFEKSIEIIPIDCTSSWDYFLSGQLEKYFCGIAETITTNIENSEAIFLAQASMEGTKELLKIDVEVVSSPEFGINFYLHSK